MAQNTMNQQQTYDVAGAAQRPEMRGQWDSAAWQQAGALDVASFHAQSSGHHPAVQAKVLYDDAGLYVHFQVDDQYVISRHDANQQSVCRDSCVEFFAQPRADKGYFNFEINCGGVIYLDYNTEAPKVNSPVADKWLKRIEIFHSLPRKIETEIVDPVRWNLEYFIPWELFEAYIGPLNEHKPGPGVCWRANFYKCADRSSQPHWASWAPIGAKLDFHQPQYFASLRFT